MEEVMLRLKCLELANAHGGSNALLFAQDFYDFVTGRTHPINGPASQDNAD